MSKGHVVVDGAICKCKFGIKPDKLVVTSQRQAFINDMDASKKLVANTKDIGNPFQGKTFGKCKLQPSSDGLLPCIPSVTQWTDFYDKVILKNKGQILTEESKATCAIAGSPCISIKFHGQTAEGIGNVEEADSDVQVHLNPLVDMKAVLEEEFIKLKGRSI